MKKTYCAYCRMNENYIMYIGYVFGSYAVFVTNDKQDTNYLVFGHYKNLGTAENRLLKSANSYKSNPKHYFYTTKEIIQKIGVLETVNRMQGVK